MDFYIKEWPDGTATLFTDNGIYLSKFQSLEIAEQACREWYNLNERGSSDTYLRSGQDASCSVCF